MSINQSSQDQANRFGTDAVQQNKEQVCYGAYARGGGNRTLDVPLNMTKVELIKESKVVFFADGVSPMGDACDFTFDLANSKGYIITTVKDNDSLEVPFTIQGYFEAYRLSKVQLYLACRLCEESDDEVLMTGVFEPSTSSGKSSRTAQDKGKTWRQHMQAQLESERVLWRNLRKEQDEEYKESLKIDREKQKALEEEMLEEVEVGGIALCQGSQSTRKAKRWHIKSARVSSASFSGKGFFFPTEEGLGVSDFASPAFPSHFT